MRIGSIVLLLAMLCSCEDGSNPNLFGGGNNGESCNFPGIDSEFLTCLENNGEETLEIVTWNLQQFPLNGSVTINRVSSIILNMNADVIALQEIKDQSSFNVLMTQLPGWDGEYLDIGGDLDYAFLFKKCEIEQYSQPVEVVESMWPRSAGETTVVHRSGLEVTLINIHLKCCDGAVNFNLRQSGSEEIKSYIDSNYPDDKVMVLGDFNDDILNGSPFSNFLSDPDNYSFADLSIAQGNSSDWSYPSFPSHIDHILITDELSSNLRNTRTVKSEPCVPGYSNHVTDHRPLLIVLE